MEYNQASCWSPDYLGLAKCYVRDVHARTHTHGDVMEREQEAPLRHGPGNKVG